MKNLKVFVILISLTVGILTLPTPGYTQEDWVTPLARRYAAIISNVQKFCIEKGKVECEIVELEQNPPFLSEGQVIGYIGVRTMGVPYFYLVVAEKEDMDPDIYLFDSQGRVLGKGGNLTGPSDLAIHVPEYTQKVLTRIRMFRGTGHIAVAILAPVGSQ
jgi:hypothetical protein